MNTLVTVLESLHAPLDMPMRLRTEEFIDDLTFLTDPSHLGVRMLVTQTYHKLADRLHFAQRESGAVAFRKALGGMKL